MNVPVAVVQALVVLIEAVPEIIEAIKSHPELNDQTKAELIARVEAARAKVNAVQPPSV